MSANQPQRSDPIIAWRKWHVDGDGNLRSIFKEKVWPARERLEATCLPGGLIHTTKSSCPVAPSDDCWCGIYGVHGPRELMSVATGPLAEFSLRGTPPRLLDVVGRVSLWGTCWRHEHGYRAQYAYPYELHVMPVKSKFHQDEADEMVRTAVRKLRTKYLVDVVAR